MPLGWRIEEAHRDLFRLYPLSTNLSLGEGHSQMVSCKAKSRRPALAYSAGVDSHACLELMPKNTLVMYHKRDGFESKLNRCKRNVMPKHLRHQAVT